MRLLEVRDLAVHFGGLVAVDRVSLSVGAGEVVGLIGPNGAGKTTCFNLMTGFLKPDGGSILFQDEEISSLPPYEIARRGLIRTFQKTSLFPRLPVLDNVMVGQQARLRPRVWPALLRTRAQRQEFQQVRERALEVLDFLEMSEQRDFPAESLPYGEQRKLEIAIAMAGKPVLLLLDEPVAGMNPEETSRLMGLIGKIREQGIGVLLVDHDMKMVMGICERIVVLDYGKKIAEGKPQEIREDPEVIRVYLGGGESRA